MAADPLPDVDTAATACRRAAAALTPRARHGEGVTVSGAGAAALADLFRALAAGQEHAVPDTACRAARRLLADLERAGEPSGPSSPSAWAPLPRHPAPALSALSAR